MCDRSCCTLLFFFFFSNSLWTPLHLLINEGNCEIHDHLTARCWKMTGKGIVNSSLQCSEPGKLFPHNYLRPSTGWSLALWLETCSWMSLMYCSLQLHMGRYIVNQRNGEVCQEMMLPLRASSQIWAQPVLCSDYWCSERPIPPH